MRLTAFAVSIAVLGLAATAWTGEPAGNAEAGSMEAMMAEMMKCAVCKHVATKMDVLGPVMESEVVTMDNGMAMMHTITDPSKVEILHAADDKMSEAGKSCMTMTDEEAAQQLCSMCQETRKIALAGGHISHGKTADGDLMVITADDPDLQKRIGQLKEKCALMMASAQ